MFLFGMKVMSEGIQKSAGDRMRKALNFMTGNRFVGVLTGFLVTGIIQSSTACTVIVISLVNTGLLTLTQSIGVIFGSNIGTTLTAWIVSLIGFKISMSNLALPAVGIGFALSIVKWRYRSLGDIIMGFGLLFLGLHFLPEGMGSIQKTINFDVIAIFRDMGFLAILAGTGAGLVLAVLVNSSTATIAIVMTMAFNDIITFHMAAGMVMGANIGTTVNAPLVALAGNAAAKRAALTHVLFNVIGACWGIPLILLQLKLVGLILPGDPMAARMGNTSIPLHLAGLHTVYNIINTLLFLPFVNQFAALVSFLVREKEGEISRRYKFANFSGAITDSPELKILRAEKEIRDMAGIAASMYASFSGFLRDVGEVKDRPAAAAALSQELKQKETYADEMREALSGFLIECTREQLNVRSENRVTQLLRIVDYIEEMTDDCYSISTILEKNVQKERIFSKEETDDLVPYLGQVQEFLVLLQGLLCQSKAKELSDKIRELQTNMAKSRKQLQKLGRKRIEAGKDIKTELFFIDLVRRVEKLGDYCHHISEALELIEVPLYKNVMDQFQPKTVLGNVIRKFGRKTGTGQPGAEQNTNGNME